MKKIFVIMLFLALSTISFSNFVFIQKIDTEIPDYLFSKTGTKSNMIYYLKLFNDGTNKGYIVKGWYFLMQQIEKTVIIIKSSTEEHKFTIQDEKDGNYLKIPTHLIICPSDAKIFIDNIEIDKKQLNGKIGEIIMPEFREMGIYILTFKDKLISKEVFSEDEEITIIVSMGLRKTGGYSLELESYDIKNNEILINLLFKEPQKEDIVTQAFTIPTYRLNIGNLKKGEYTVKVKIKTRINTLHFSKSFKVK